VTRSPTSAGTLPSDIRFVFIRASGPGGQNVNKVATGVQLRFDVRGSRALSDAVRDRLMRLAGRRITATGELIIEARRFRTQEQNRQDALERLARLLDMASVPPRVRHKTKPSAASRQRRLEAKRHRSVKKRLRSPTQSQDDWL
jgi:ribosome-associated protein